MHKDPIKVLNLPGKIFPKKCKEIIVDVSEIVNIEPFGNKKAPFLNEALMRW
jgi:hypothetical protein